VLGLPASAEGTAHAEASLRQVEQYNYSIHILAMLLVGFGFLMVFVKKRLNPIELIREPASAGFSCCHLHFACIQTSLAFNAMRPGSIP
jgi:hypothetical protein